MKKLLIASFALFSASTGFAQSTPIQPAATTTACGGFVQLWIGMDKTSVLDQLGKTRCRITRVSTSNDMWDVFDKETGRGDQLGFKEGKVDWVETDLGDTLHDDPTRVLTTLLAAIEDAMPGQAIEGDGKTADTALGGRAKSWGFANIRVENIGDLNTTQFKILWINIGHKSFKLQCTRALDGRLYMAIEEDLAR